MPDAQATRSAAQSPGVVLDRSGPPPPAFGGGIAAAEPLFASMSQANPDIGPDAASTLARAAYTDMSTITPARA